MKECHQFKLNKIKKKSFVLFYFPKVGCGLFARAVVQVQTYVLLPIGKIIKRNNRCSPTGSTALGINKHTWAIDYSRYRHYENF